MCIPPGRHCQSKNYGPPLTRKSKRAGAAHETYYINAHPGVMDSVGAEVIVDDSLEDEDSAIDSDVVAAVEKDVTSTDPEVGLTEEEPV